jgi:hypothetical protein
MVNLGSRWIGARTNLRGSDRDSESSLQRENLRVELMGFEAHIPPESRKAKRLKSSPLPARVGYEPRASQATCADRHWGGRSGEERRDVVVVVERDTTT